jgi:Protein of unknown function (DUF2844)
MTPSSAASLARIGALLTILTLPSTVSASLGGNTSSVDADRVHAQGALMRIVRSDTYALHEIRSATGTTIREYVNSSGTVFAVAWQGPWMPDLRQVLGDRFVQYQAALQANQRARRGRGAVVIDQPDLVVQISGHQRAFTGRAYVPALLPAGVQLDAIR